MIAHYFNEVLADTVVAYLQERLNQDPAARIRIFEIGAGTGGTSTTVFQKLKPYQNHIQEYCYTDISKAFLLHAENEYGPENPFLTYKLVDIGRPIVEQNIGSGEYDIVIAANVLHATKNIRQTLRNAKTVLKSGGLILLNEIVSKSLFTHLTFGLLEGWWLYEDEEIRVPGSPGLSMDNWRKVLELEGFGSVFFPAKESEEWGQQIIVAESDGVVHVTPNVTAPAPALKKPVEAQPIQTSRAQPKESAILPQANVTQQMVEDFVRETIIEKLSESLKVDSHLVDLHDSFSDYGVDSITGIKLVQAINQALKINLETTNLFDYSSVNQLTAYILSQYNEAMTELVAKSVGGTQSAHTDSAIHADNAVKVLHTDHALHAVNPTESAPTVAARTTATFVDNRFTEQQKLDNRATQAKPAHAKSTQQDGNSGTDAVAIIGVSGRFPQSKNVNALWEHLVNGSDLVGEVTRWDLSQYYAEGTKYCNQGGFLDDIDQFDPAFFHISGTEAIYMDPHQRLFLEESWKALEDAGYAGNTSQGARCGVYVGFNDLDYRLIYGENPPPQAFWGNASSVIPARISYYLDLQGPAIAVDTACSSSLVAIHLACQALLAHETEMALAGGVFIQSTPNFYLSANRAGMLSPGGRCFTFDERADGFVPGEGIGVFVLKRLSDAIADGDQIYGVIRGTAINQDGTTNGITAPSAKSQERLETEVYDTFGIHPEQLQMVEAHGTGTQLGDPIEYQALTRAFRAYTDKTEFCAIGSIKTNIGHTASAAGSAGLIKILMSLKHKQIPPSIHYRAGNPNIQFQGSPFYVNTTTKEWTVEPGMPRMAAISAFGFSGTNAHMVIEEAPVVVRNHSQKPGYLIVLSALTTEQLRQQAQQLIAFCEHEPQVDCGNMSYTLLVGRKHMNCRLACVVRSQDELVTYLKKWLEKGKVSQVYVAELLKNDQREQPSLKRYGNECIENSKRASHASEYLEQLSTVADLYIQGYELEYPNLFADEQYSRISLPTYPFARERYWVTQVESANSPLPKAAVNTASASASKALDIIPATVARATTLHPLLHENTSDLSEQRYSSTFTGQEFFLADHVVNGRKVLPGVAYLEMARAAVERATGEWQAGETVIRLKNVVWASPIHVDETPVEVHIGLDPEENGEIHYEIYGDLTEDAIEPTVFSQGSAMVSPLSDAARLELAHLQAQCNQRTLTSAQCYEAFGRMGLAYGAGHQGIERVYVGTDMVLAKLTLPSCIADTYDQYVMHPSLMDSALQAAVGLVAAATADSDGQLTDDWITGKPVLPFALQELEVLRPGTSSMWALIRYSAGSTAEDKVQKLDIDLCDDHGMICARLRGFTSRVLEGGAGHTGQVSQVAGSTVTAMVTATDSVNGTLLLTPVWKEQAVERDATAPTFTQQIVMLCESHEYLYETITSEWNGVRCIRLQSGLGGIEEQFSACAAQALEEIQRILQDKPREDVLIQIIIPNQGVQQLFAGLTGLLKTARLENPKLIGQLIEVEPGEVPEGIIKKLGENSRRPMDIHIRYEKGKRLVARWSEVELAQHEVLHPWKDHGVYLITGGAGGLGQIFAQDIARKVNNATLILTGRSPLGADKQAAIQALESNGTKVEYRIADVSQKQSVDSLLTHITEAYGTLHGIIHAAGVIRDNYLIRKTTAELTEVFAPKVAGVIHLDQASQHLPLDFLILFSAAAGAIGNPGQADYSMANSFMDGYAAYRNTLVSTGRRQGQTVAFNWPLWKDGGMQVDAETEKMLMQSTGMIAMRTGTGIQALYQGLAAGKHQIMAGEGHVTRMKQALHVTGEPRDRNRQHDEVQASLVNLVSRMLQVEAAEIDVDVELTEYGFDQVMMSELVNRLNQMYGVELSIAALFEYQNLRSMAGYLAGMIEETVVRPRYVQTGQDKDQTIQAKVVDVAVTVPSAKAGQANMTYAGTVPSAQTSAAASSSQDTLQEKAIHYLKKLLSSVIQLPEHKIEADAPMEKYGIDSLMVMQLTNQLEQSFGSLSKTLFFEYQNIRELTGYFLESHREKLIQLLGIGVETTPNATVALEIDGKPSSVKGQALHQAQAQGQAQALNITQAQSPSQVQTATRRKSRKHTRSASARYTSASVTTNTQQPQTRDTADTTQPTDIAIIGLSGRYPGAANIHEFWKNLRDGKDCITEIPQDRWDHSLYYDKQKDTPGKTYAKWGGFLDGVTHFDPLFFNISPREAELMDPQERLFLQSVYEAIEDAGYTREALAAYRSSGMEGNVGVYVGVMYEEYQLYGAQAQVTGHPIALSGNPSAIANRVSYFCNFHGPSVAVDTMCSSSLTALHFAAQSLQKGECELAIAGGVNLSLHPNKYLMLAQGRFASSKGRCESFGEGGDGYVPGEGVGAVLLKPLSKAVADGDQIYGIIKGTAINHGGKTNGYTVPNPNAHANVISRALTEAGINPRTISYIEAHGTGTSLGDPIEIAGLNKTFKEYTTDKQFCAIGSAKSNIGHAESAAGIAGLTKVLLQLKYQQLVPSLHSKALNPNIDFTQSPFVVQQELTEWRRPVIEVDGITQEYPRRAGLSSFGAGGSNAHIVIEEYIPDHTINKTNAVSISPDHPAVIVLSAKNEERLKEQVQQLLGAIDEYPLTDADLADIAYTLQVGRDAMDVRLALLAHSIQDLKEKLTGYTAGQEPISDVYHGHLKQGKETLSLFTADEELQEAVQKWVQRRKYPKLLDLWVKGLQVDWDKLYGDVRPRKISLPTYPFAKEHYWIPQADAKGFSSGNVHVSTEMNPYLHPLLHQNTSDFLEQRFSSTFTGNEFFLADHVVMGQKVLPGVAYLEMTRAAVEQAAGAWLQDGTITVLKDIVWMTPIRVADQAVQVHIGLTPKGNDEIGFEIYSKDVTTGEKNVVYSQGNAVLQPVGEIPGIPLASIHASCGRRTLSAAQCYQAFQAAGIEYGPRHQGLQVIHVGADQVLAKLSLPAELAAGLQSYVLHPSIMDAALQASVGLVIGSGDVGSDSDNTTSGAPALPFALEEIEIYQPCQSSMWAWVRYSEGSTAGDQVQKLDIDLCDEQGSVCVRMRGFTSRVSGGDVKNIPVEPSSGWPDGTLLLTPLWDTVSLPQGQPFPSQHEKLVIIGGDELSRHEVRQYYPLADVIEIRPSSTVDEITAKLQAYGTIDHIWWIAPAYSQASVGDDSLIEGQEAGVLQLFGLIKSLLHQGYGSRDLGWTIITTQAQPIHHNDQVNAVHASVHGLIGSMAKEYTNWKVRLVDLEADTDWPLQEIITLPPDPQGDPYVYRLYEWYRQELVEVNSNPIGHTAYRHGGVYVVIGGAGGIGEAWSEYMIRTYQAQIIWIGRRAKDTDIQAKLDRLAAWGPAPTYLSADATNESELRRAYQQIKAQHPQIHGVIQSAIVLLDRSLAYMDEDRFRTGLSAKVDVSVRMAQVFRDEPLDFVLFFSSLNAFTKSAGQSNYVAGCTFKDAFAHQLSTEWSCGVKVMNWGYWGSVGTVASSEYQDRMAAAGIGSIEPPEAMKALEVLLAGPMDQLALMKTTKPMILPGVNREKSVTIYS
nr:SDR family NAD(P)-dependent oxidoreductase [Brevibacillus dissolubilis]